MRKQVKWCMGPVWGLFLIMTIEASCTVVKEDRTDCPCALHIELSGLPSYPVNLSLSGKGYQQEWEIGRDTSLLAMVPKSGVQLLAIAGTSLPRENAVRIPLGFDCPPLYLHTEWLETPEDSSRVKVQLQKHFCTLSLSFDGPAGWGEPYWAEVRGPVEGLSLEGEPLEGDFSCRLDVGNRIRLPRQNAEDALWLDIAMPDRVIRSFALSHYMQDAGYDWSADNLDDLPLQINLSVTALTFRTGRWEQVVPLDVEI